MTRQELLDRWFGRRVWATNPPNDVERQANVERGVPEDTHWGAGGIVGGIREDELGLWLEFEWGSSILVTPETQIDEV